MADENEEGEETLDGEEEIPEIPIIRVYITPEEVHGNRAYRDRLKRGGLDRWKDQYMDGVRRAVSGEPSPGEGRENVGRVPVALA